MMNKQESHVRFCREVLMGTGSVNDVILEEKISVESSEIFLARLRKAAHFEVPKE